MKSVLLSAIFLLVPSAAFAQKMAVSTNILGYAALGTLNAEVSYSVSQHWSVVAGVKYNPFTYRSGDVDRQFQIRQQSYAAGVRLWPWHTLSGWWFSSKLRYQEYNFGGIRSKEAAEGDRAGIGLYAGYTHMLSSRFNLEFGLGMWAGADWYRRYSCTLCGLTLDSGTKAFVLPDDLAVSLVYVF